MKLLKFRVTNFRSVEDSGWIQANEVTSLIGTNESGKTNLLIPLWKLNPAKGGEINQTSDFPRKKFNQFRILGKKPIFIQAWFSVDDELIKIIKQRCSYVTDGINTISISKDFSGNLYFNFPELILPTSINKSEIISILETSLNEITQLTPQKSESTIVKRIIDDINNNITNLKNNFADVISNEVVLSLINVFNNLEISNTNKTSAIVPRYKQLIEDLQEIYSTINLTNPIDIPEIMELIKKYIPKFVYYSNYGNLDSEIYLPHVIENIQRNNLGAHEEAKVRTLKVLFDFVKLHPEEILELGKDIPSNQNSPSEEEIHKIAEKKKERDILMQSAGSELTEKFRDWWKQGEYRFRFQADGDHFRIWVSDDKRPEDIELEGRSSGLQWFLSFYLIFLVESHNAHEGAILLLDEPGLTLHPIAQKDLSAFFNNLSKTNQIIFTTHSPFMIDSNQLDRVRVVYVNDKGTTSVSENLRITEGKKEQSRSIYPVYAALGLSISDTIMLGCQSVIVEGQSDQFYLSTIKSILIKKGIITPNVELLFIPGGGVKGIQTVVSIVSGKDESLPYVILDSDKPGIDLSQKLLSTTYSNEKQKIILISTITNIENSEIEDLIPIDIISKIVTKMLSNNPKDFDEIVNKKMPLVPQIEEYANENDIILETPGWKVDLAKRVKQKMLNSNSTNDIDDNYQDMWRKLFKKILEIPNNE
jgi:predicted ATP-dependent endonuclease of OLD family